jgi:hypothetical protein
LNKKLLSISSSKVKLDVELKRKALPPLKLLFLFILFSISQFAFANSSDVCRPVAVSLQKGCKRIEYTDLPEEIHSLMKKQLCDVDTKSNYNYGHAMDLNDDGEFEYAFCCSEAPHGPCGARIFAKINKKWQSIQGKNGFFAFDSECSGISILETKSNGFHDLCFGNLPSPLRKFSNGIYRPIQ